MVILVSTLNFEMYCQRSGVILWHGGFCVILSEILGRMDGYNGLEYVIYAKFTSTYQIILLRQSGHSSAKVV